MPLSIFSVLVSGQREQGNGWPVLVFPPLVKLVELRQGPIPVYRVPPRA